jgi:hypothetical protein
MIQKGIVQESDGQPAQAETDAKSRADCQLPCCQYSVPPFGNSKRIVPVENQTIKILYTTMDIFSYHHSPNVIRASLILAKVSIISARVGDCQYANICKAIATHNKRIWRIIFLCLSQHTKTNDNRSNDGSSKHIGRMVLVAGGIEFKDGQCYIRMCN